MNLSLQLIQAVICVRDLLFNDGLLSVDVIMPRQWSKLPTDYQGSREITVNTLICIPCAVSERQFLP